MLEKEIEKDQAYVSPLTKYIQSKTRRTSNLSSEHFQDQDRKYTLLPLLASQRARNRSKRQRKRKNRFDASDGRKQLDIQIFQSPRIFKIQHNPSKKQPMDLPESLQMINIYYVEDF